ncbi:MAG TPA: YdeI/OmpD-associated family protein, partial [Aeromicrobium sp.]|nr:YdeI/OmpD-associated family protein [Aeromicrobium sp.]
MHTGGTDERPALFFADATEFREWLAANHATATELWMGLYKKHVEPRGLTWEDAVPEALCFGWIDSRVERIDEDAVRQRWTPRRPSSTWSQVNIDLVAKLTAEGRMQAAGLAAFEKRKPERSAIYFYENPDRELPAEYARLIDANPRAAQFWAAATPSYRKHAKAWVLSAKQEATRERRMAALVDDCAAGRLIKTQRYGTEPA